MHHKSDHHKSDHHKSEKEPRLLKTKFQSPLTQMEMPESMSEFDKMLQKRTSVKARPLPNATAEGSKFHAGEMRTSRIAYPHLPKCEPVKMVHPTYPSLASTGMKAPATKRPMGMTVPIMTKRGGHPLDTATSLPPIGRG